MTQAVLWKAGVRNDTLIFLTSDNGPYQEEGWGKSGRTNVYNPQSGERIGRQWHPIRVRVRV